MNRNLDVILTVIAKGYDVTIKINGSDVGVNGQGSESVKLFGVDSPMKPVLPPDMQNQICLEEGDNSIHIQCKRTKEESPSELTVELQAKEQFVNAANLFSKKELLNVGDERTFSDQFTL